MKKNLSAGEVLDLLVFDLLKRSGVERVVFRQVYGKYQSLLREHMLYPLIDAILLRLGKRSTGRRTGATRRFLAFLMKVLVSERVGIAIPDFKPNDFSRWVVWGSQIKTWLEARQAKDEKVL